MIDNRENALEVVALLNEMLRIDRNATTSLVEDRIPCNVEFMDHPKIVCKEGGVGLLGVLNAFFSSRNRLVARYHSGEPGIVDFQVKDLSENDVDGFECEYCWNTVTRVRPDDDGYVWGYCDRCAPGDATVFDGNIKPGTVLEGETVT